MKNDAGRIVEWLGSATDIDERKHSEDNLRFLADASVALSEVGDVEGTLRRIAALAVPYFADWCEVAVKEGSGEVRRLGVNHLDPERVKHLEEIDRLYPRDDQSAAAKVMASREAMFEPQVSDEMLRRVARTPQHFEMLRKLALRSFICVPMNAKSGVPPRAACWSWTTTATPRTAWRCCSPPAATKCASPTTAWRRSVRRSPSIPMSC